MTNPEIIKPTQNERLLASLSHLSILIPSLFFINLSFIAPFIIWVAQKDKSQYVAVQSFQALTYQLCRSIVLLIGNACLYISIFIVNTRAFVPISGGNLIISFIFIAYGIVGTVLVFQGKPFRYLIIGNQAEQALPTIMAHKQIFYVILIGIIVVCVLILFGVFIFSAIGQANA